MSRSLPALQEHARAASDAFCQRYDKPSRRKRRRNSRQTIEAVAPPNKQRPKACPEQRRRGSTVYRPRDHETSPFFRLVRERFDDFESAYPEKYQERYGYWRPVIRSSIDKFMKPVVSLSNHAEISRKGSRGCAVRNARKSSSWHSHAASAPAAPPATRNAPLCSLIALMRRCLLMCRTVSGSLPSRNG